MAYKDEPNWVSGRLGRLTLEPPITHLAFCPCSQCPAYREKRAARLGLPLAQVIAEPIDIRVKRNSPYPRNRSLSKEAALRMKEAEERRLNELAAGVQAAEVAKTNAVPFRRVVDHYRNYMIVHKKGYEHERYRIDKIEAFVGADRDVATIDYDLYTALLDEYQDMSAQTRRHYATTLLAMLKRAKAERVIKSHQLADIILPPAPRNGDPQPWTRRELGMLMGPALLEYEADQAAWNAKVAEEKKNRGLRSPSAVPLRGYCLIGYYTMMRPDCNLHLRWDEVTLDAKNLTGWYKLDQHKNVNKGIKAEGPLAEELVEYLLSIRPVNPGNAPIHFNPETGLPYVDIRKQWERLMVIASRMLRYDLEDKKRTFFNFRHTGASHIAQRGKTPAHLLAVVQMMGDTSVATVNRHYFKMEPELMRNSCSGGSARMLTGRPSGRPIFSAPSTHAFARSSFLSPANARRGHAMANRRARFPHRYTIGRLTRDGKRVPLVRVSGRWLEAFGFKEGAKFTAIGVEGGLLVFRSTKPRRVAARPRVTRRVRSRCRMMHFRRAILSDLLAPILALRSAPC